MVKKILVDSAFKEETRVALVENDALQDYDREDFNFKQLKGNVYLARITRIEPSLQAAFVDYGGDRHGFLPFSDIHPDYYNIEDVGVKGLQKVKFLEKNDDLQEVQKNSDNINSNGININNEQSVDGVDKIADNSYSEHHTNHENKNFEVKTESSEAEYSDKNTSSPEEDYVDTIHNYSVDEETINENNLDDYTRYKIEEVLKEGQYLLVQVLKEERGNKGVAMTTYISIAGKYCVLMANSLGKGGVSKKVVNLNERKILKSILRSLNVPQDKSIILRTAGVSKKPEEILKDYLYLIKLWSAIKKSTMESKAPAFVHAEDDIIKKTIRDIYTDDVSEIIVEGEDSYKAIKLLIGIVDDRRENIVRLHNDKVPLFQKFNIEDQLSELYNNKINLLSGGSIVIDQTEALVAIDVNSGKATKEKTVEEMAVATNIEAANEIARQLKLRDLAGLVVIDFIDMFELKNRRTVEKAMRDAMSTDRARIQIARLSIFGLMELSRQRLGASFTERVSEVCPRCKGKGKIKSKEIVALSILRAIRYASTDKQINVVTVETTPDLCEYLLNFKRKEINQIEQNYDIYIFIEKDDAIDDNNYNIKKRKGLTPEERLELDPQQKTGKVNLEFGNDELHSISNAEIKKYKFEDEVCYGNSNNIPKRVSKKPHNNRYNRINYNGGDNNQNRNKKGKWFKGLFDKYF